MRLQLSAEELRQKLDIKNGEDYVLTEKDKKEIASKIDVPIVEKVIIEQPIVKEVAVTDTALQIASKLNSEEGIIEQKVIIGLEDSLNKKATEAVQRGGGSGGVFLHVGGAKKGKVNSINFAGATYSKVNGLDTVTVGASQTPWTSNIDAASYNLSNVGKLGIGNATIASVVVSGCVPTTYNGTYTYRGEYHSAHYYQLGTQDKYIGANAANTYWYISTLVGGAPGGSVPDWYKSGSGSTPPFVSTWIGEQGGSGTVTTAAGDTNLNQYLDVTGDTIVYGGNFYVGMGSISVNQTLKQRDRITIGDPPGSGYPGIWMGSNASAPSYTNYSFLFDEGGGTIFNTPTGSAGTAFRTANVNLMTINANGVAIGFGAVSATVPASGNNLIVKYNTGLGGVSAPTAYVHIGAGTATAGTAPLKFTSGTNLTTPEAGAMEFNGTRLYFSPSTTRNTIGQIAGTTLTSGAIPYINSSGYLDLGDSSALGWDHGQQLLTSPRLSLQQGILHMYNMPTSDPADGNNTLWYDSGTRQVYVGT